MKIYSTNPPTLLTNQFDFTQNHLEPNIDLALEYENGFHKDVTIHLNVLSISIIGGLRLDKLHQSLILDQFGIRTPKTYFNRKTFNPFHSIEEFDSFCELKEFVVKPINGARGIGVKTINRKNFKELIENPKSVEKTFSKELEKQRAYADDISPSYVEDQFYNRSMLVQELVKVDREFRLLCFPTEVLVYERKKGDEQFLGNLSHGSTPIPMAEKDINQIDSAIIYKIRLIMERFKYPWLSVDLYTDTDNNMGVFEFQMEFAYEGFNPTDVRNAMEKSLKSFINKKYYGRKY